MEEFKDVVIAILNRYPGQRWPDNITDLVFLAIQQDPDYYKRYKEFKAGHKAANSQIGRFVKDYTGKKAGKTITNPASKLIKTYTLLE
jgi:hypothetical protein